MKRTQIHSMLVAVLLVTAAAALAVRANDPPLSSGNSTGISYDLTWHTIDNGGGTSTGGAPGNEYELSGTIAQPDAGVMSGGDYQLAGGFWAGDPGVTPLCPGDLTDTGEVNVDDLLLVLNNWGSCPGGTPGCAGDASNDGTVNVDDLLIVLNYWGLCP